MGHEFETHRWKFYLTDIINAIKINYSNAKIKISSNDNYININNGVFQGSLLSPILFNIYINDLIEDLNYIAFEILAYANDLCVLWIKMNY